MFLPPVFNNNIREGIVFYRIFAHMDNRYFFEPRVGGNYYTQGFCGLRILVLGVAHICDLPCAFHDICGNPDRVRDMDRECPVYKGKDERLRLSGSNLIEIDSFIEGSARYPAYSLFTYYMTGSRDTLSPSEKQRFWDSVAFTNYLQYFLDSDELDGLDGADMDRARASLDQVIEQIRPQIIFAWNPAVCDSLRSNSGAFSYIGMADLEFGLSVYIFAVRKYECKAAALRKLRYRFKVKSVRHNLPWYKELVKTNLYSSIVIPSDPDNAKPGTARDTPDTYVKKMAEYLLNLVGDKYLGATEDSLYFADSERFKWTTGFIATFIKHLKVVFKLGRGANEGFAAIFGLKGMEKYTPLEPLSTKQKNLLDLVHETERSH